MIGEEQKQKDLIEKCLLEEFYPYPNTELDYCEVEGTDVRWRIKNQSDYFATPLETIYQVYEETYGGRRFIGNVLSKEGE
jgi:hypothetical protein